MATPDEDDVPSGRREIVVIDVILTGFSPEGKSFFPDKFPVHSSPHRVHSSDRANTEYCSLE